MFQHQNKIYLVFYKQLWKHNYYNNLKTKWAKTQKNYCNSKNTNGADTFQMVKQYQLLLKKVGNTSNSHRITDVSSNNYPDFILLSGFHF